MSTQNSSKSKQWLKRIIITLVLLELIYLVAFNILLNTAYVQKQINDMEPEKFQLQWERAWTPYPMRVHMEKLTAKGNSGSKEWQVEVDSASVSLSLLALMGHKVKLCNVMVGDIAYTEKPNLSADITQSIAAQKVDASKTATIVTGNDGEKNPWYLELRGVKIYGHHTVETDQFKGDLNGDIDTDLTVTTKDGLLSAKNGKIHIVINSLHNHKGQEIVKQGTIKSAFKISPVNFREKRRGELLKYLALDSAITAQMENLDIFDRQLQRIRKIQLIGKGALESQIHLSNGKLLPGTKLRLNASDLTVKKRGYLVHGDGKIQLAVTNKNPDILDSKIRFGNFQTYRIGDGKEADESGKREVSLFHGKGLTLNSKASSVLYPKPSAGAPVSYLGLVIPPVTVDDLSRIQQYIPEKWGVEFYRGKGILQGKADMSEEEMSATIKLLSKDTEIGFDEQRVQSDLDMMIKMKVSPAPKLHADLTGTYIALSNTRLSNQKESDKRESKTWNTKLKIKQGTVMLPLPEENSVEPLSTILRKHKVKDILAKAEGQLKVTGDISQLDWVNLLMKSSLDFTVSGSGIVEADLLVKNGSLAKKSTARIKSKNLQVGLLDYQYNGVGEFTAEKTDGRGASAAIYALDFTDATMKRKGEKEAKIENVAMRLERVNPQDSKEDKVLRLQILSAKVKNVSLYNQYFPENAPFVFADGSADLSADILLESNDTKGYVKLMTSGLTMKVDDQTISGRLRINTKIIGGEPKKMKFDISGSTIVFDQAKVSGKNAGYSKDDWRMAVKFKKADIVWKKPLELKSETLLLMKDSRPIVAMIDNKKAKFALLSNLLIVENLRGEAMVNMKDNTITIPHALVKTNKIDIGAKAIITSTLRNGMIYFGHKNIRAAIEIRDGKKSIDIFNAQQSFDNYVIPFPVPSIQE